MHHVEQMNIILVVEDEKSLYTNFSPEAEFDHDVKEYIKSKIAGEEDNKSVQLTVVSQDPLDEEKFRSAVSNWISDEKKVLRQSEKNTTRLFFRTVSLRIYYDFTEFCFSKPFYCITKYADSDNGFCLSDQSCAHPDHRCAEGQSAKVDIQRDGKK